MFKFRKELVISIAVILTLATGCSSKATPNRQNNISNPQKIAQKIVPTPSQLGHIRTNAEGIIVDASKKEWNKVQSRLNTIKTSFNQLKPMMQINNKSKKVLDEMGKAINNLEKQVSAKNEYRTMLDANALTKLVPDALDIFRPKTTTDLGRLSYYGREINLNVDQNNWTSAKGNLIKIEKIWASMKTKVSSVNRRNTSNFTTIINDLNRSITDKNSTAVKTNVKRMLDAVNLMESNLIK